MKTRYSHNQFETSLDLVISDRRYSNYLRKDDIADKRLAERSVFCVCFSTEQKNWGGVGWWWTTAGQVNLWLFSYDDV